MGAWHKLLGFSLLRQRLFSAPFAALLLASCSRIVLGLTRMPAAAHAACLITGFEGRFLNGPANGRMYLTCASLGSGAIAVSRVGDASGFAGDYLPRARFRGLTSRWDSIHAEIRLRYLIPFGFNALRTQQDATNVLWLLPALPAGYGVRVWFLLPFLAALTATLLIAGLLVIALRQMGFNNALDIYRYIERLLRQVLTRAEYRVYRETAL
jgi:hypothetical protein